MGQDGDLVAGEVMQKVRAAARRKKVETWMLHPGQAR
jgi:hypothetical protein